MATSQGTADPAPDLVQTIVLLNVTEEKSGTSAYLCGKGSMWYSLFSHMEKSDWLPTSVTSKPSKGVEW